MKELRDIIKIYSNDGKEFAGTDYNVLIEERNTYESSVALKKQKEEAERKAKEEKEKKLQDLRAAKLKEINEDLVKVNNKIKSFEEETGNKLVYVYNWRKKVYELIDVINTLDYAYYDAIRNIFSTVTKYK